MGLFGKLFGRKPAPEIPAVENKPLRSIEDLRKDPNQIQVFDKFGQEMFIEKEKWRTDILPGAIRDHWDKPDELYGVIFGALNDGFRSDVVAAAKRLYAIDSNPSRGSCVWGIVLMEEGRLDEAERIFRKYLSRHGEEGSVLTNLAKVYARQNDNSRAEQILWHALEVEPYTGNAGDKRPGWTPCAALPRCLEAGARNSGWPGRPCSPSNRGRRWTCTGRPLSVFLGQYRPTC